MREVKKYHIVLTLTQERSNSPSRDIAHAFQPKDSKETSNGSEYLTQPFANPLMPLWSFLFGLCKGEKNSKVKEKKNIVKIISLTYNLDRL